MVAAAAVGIAAIFTCDDARMRTAVVSDLHLGHGAGADLLRRPAFVDRLLEAVDGVDRLVLLGDVVEMRDIPLSESIAVARPLFARLAEALAGAEIVIVGGNHDHHLVERWLEDRALRDAAPLELEHRFEPTGGCVRGARRGRRRMSGRGLRTRGSGCATTSTPPTATSSTGT